MKKILLAVIVLIGLKSFGQGGWTRPNQSHGTLQKGTGGDSANYTPTGSGAPSGAIINYTAPIKKGNIYIDSTNNRLYFYNPKDSTWSYTNSTETSALPLTDNFLSYNIPFASTSFTDSILVSQLQSGTTSYYFNKGLWLNGSYSGVIDSSRIIAYNYGKIINSTYTQKLLFKVGDSSSVLKIGLGVKSDQASGNNINAVCYLDVTLGDSSTSTLNNRLSSSVASSTSKTGVLINKGDWVYLQANHFEDSVVIYYRNLTNNNSANLVRKVNYAIGTQYASIYGYPTLFFKAGNAKAVSWDIAHEDYDVLVLSSSFVQGHNVDSMKYAWVNRLKPFTNARIMNGARSAGYTTDYLQVKKELEIRNKTIILPAIYSLGSFVGKNYATIKAETQAFVDRLRLGGNTLIHTDAPYRASFLGIGGWGELVQLNNWLDTAYAGIDTIVHWQYQTAANYPAWYADGAHFNNTGNIELSKIFLQQAAPFFPLLPNVKSTMVDSLYHQLMASDTDGRRHNISWANVRAGLVGGTGSLNFVPKWTPNGTSLGNSQIFDNGTNVGINNASPSYKLDLLGSGTAAASIAAKFVAGTSAAAGGLLLGSYDATDGAIWASATGTPSQSNYAFRAGTGGTNLNAPTGTGIDFRIAGTSKANISPGGTFSVTTNGAASTPAGLFSGTWLRSSATGVAQLVINESGATALSTLSASGTGVAINATSGTGDIQNWLVNNLSYMKISAQTGILNVFSDVISGRDVIAGSTNNFMFNGSSRIKTNSDGVLQLGNQANNDFGRLQFGGTTSSFPAIARNATGIDIKLADNSAYTTLTAGNLTSTGNVNGGFGFFSGFVEHPAIRGGTTTTSSLTYKTTSGVGTTGADHIFQVGNNGATEAMRILNNGNVGVGIAAPSQKFTVANSGGVETFQAGMAQGVGGSGYGSARVQSANGSYQMVMFASTGAQGLLSDQRMVFAPGATETVTFLPSGNVGIGTTSPTQKLQVTAGRFGAAKGANVASAGDLTLGSDGNTFHITGTTTINAIITTNWQAGSEIILIFDASLTVKNNTAGGGSTAVMLLAGGSDFSSTANDVLKLVYDGTSFYEVSRSVN